MKRSTVRFSQLQHLLEGMGFEGRSYDRGWLYKHAPSGAEFMFRRYRPSEFVYFPDLLKVQSHLDWRGLMTPEAFDSALTKTPA